MTNFPWIEQLNLNSDTNWQVKTFTEIFLNIMSNYIPNEIKRFVPRDPPWITKPIKTMLNRKNRLFKKYKKHRYKDEDRLRLDAFRAECQKVVETAKLTYLNNLGKKVNEHGTSQKKDQWKLYLYGDPSISIADNKIIFLSTIKYVKETKRFAT